MEIAEAAWGRCWAATLPTQSAKAHPDYPYGARDYPYHSRWGTEAVGHRSHVPALTPGHCVIVAPSCIPLDGGAKDRGERGPLRCKRPACRRPPDGPSSPLDDGYLSYSAGFLVKIAILRPKCAKLGKCPDSKTEPGPSAVACAQGPRSAEGPSAGGTEDRG